MKIKCIVVALAAALALSSNFADAKRDRHDASLVKSDQNQNVADPTTAGGKVEMAGRYDEFGFLPFDPLYDRLHRLRYRLRHRLGRLRHRLDWYFGGYPHRFHGGYPHHRPGWRGPHHPGWRRPHYPGRCRPQYPDWHRPHCHRGRHHKRCRTKIVVKCKPFKGGPFKQPIVGGSATSGTVEELAPKKATSDENEISTAPGISFDDEAMIGDSETTASGEVQPADAPTSSDEEISIIGSETTMDDKIQPVDAPASTDEKVQPADADNIATEATTEAGITADSTA